VRGVIALSVVIVFVTASCSSQTQVLLNTLPVVGAGMALEQVTVVDESRRSGHPMDDVLMALGKSRRDAIIVFRSASSGGPSVGAVTVTGVIGADLLIAVVDNLQSAAVISRTMTTAAGKDVWLIESRPDHLAAAYSHGDVVYLALSDERLVVDDLLAVMP